MAIASFPEGRLSVLPPTGEIFFYNLEHQNRLQVAFEGARGQLKIAAEWCKARYDEHIWELPLGEGQLVLLRGFNVRGWDNIHDLWSSVAYQILKAAKTGGSVYSIAPVNDLSKVRQVQRSALNLWISKDPGHGSPELAMPEPL